MRPRLLALATAAAAVVLAAPSAAPAQLLDAKAIALDGARRMMAAAEAEARRNGWNVSIAVVDAWGELLLFQRLDDAPPSSVAVAQAKARTAARFRRPTKALEDAVAGGRAALLSFDGVAMIEGGVPVVVGGKVIGAIGVSGVTSAQDGVVAQAGVAALRP